MAKSGRVAPEHAADASLAALVDAERRFEERLEEARRQAAVEDESLTFELRVLEERAERETAAAEEALASRIAAGRDDALRELREASAARVAAWVRVDGEEVDRLAAGVIERVLGALGALEAGS